ncbi:nematocyst expressed protein 3-like [Bacillus rossius redtenbacheri]|uniref:nematocyst expressed protein 3-like n=1 Tax=Bacillus rossius redtenbacheri TaxID=93214 RepID=UPI002FDDBFF9
MKVAAALLLLFAACASAGLLAPSSYLVRTPSLDSAVIKSDRLGGNFAYSSVEGHAYQAVSPVVQSVVAPVGVSYTAHQVPLGYAVPHAYPGVVAAYPGLIAAPAPIAPLAPSLIPAAIAAPAVVAADEPAVAPAAPAAPAAEADDTVSVESA